MAIFNKRNAFIGWMAWNAHKRSFRKKAKAATPAVEDGKPNRPAVGLAAGVAALGGVLFFWRKRTSGGGGGDAVE